MATTSNTRTTSLAGRVAAEKNPASPKLAADQQIVKQKVAAAWTLAKTMLPGAPYNAQLAFAKNLMANSATALKVATRQTAINAHYTKIAESFEKVHKVDLNDLLEDPSILSKEEKAVAAELKGDAKSASAKVADDRKDAGPLPAEYPEPKRDEPKELDASHAGEGRPEHWTEGPSSKEAGKKTACDEGCKGDCEHMKAAAAKKADVDGQPLDEAEAAADDAEGDAAEAGDDAAAAEGDADAAEGDAAAAEGDAAAAEAPVEEFDEETANLEDAVEDLKSDIDALEDAVTEFSENPSDITFEGEGEELPLDGEFDGDLFGDGEAAPTEGAEGEELNLNDIFDEGALDEKVAALNDEEMVEAGEDDFFGPSDAADLEAQLEAEEGLTEPADMFNLEGVDDDPLARIFASKQASEGVVEPGELDSYFETDLSGDDRDAESDHDDDIFASVYKTLQQPKRNDQRDTEAKLEAPKNTKEAAGKKAAPAPKQAGVRRIRQTASQKEAASLGNLAALLFPDDADFQ